MEPVQRLDVVCPYCGEQVRIAVEADLGGELIQDCEVCCHPWRLRLQRTGDELQVEAKTLDE